MQTEQLKSSLPPLPFPVTFVCNYPQKWSELFLSSSDSLPNPKEIHSRIITNEDCWIVLTYLYLKQRHLNVSISDRFLPGEICVVSSIDFRIRHKTFSSYVVGCRSDGHKPVLCNFAIVQNQANVESETDILIPHWPQPGLIPRNQERGNRIENLVFKGHEGNLYEAFRSPEFIQELEDLGVRLVISPKPKNQPVQWHDYSDADLVIAVRDLPQKDYLVKPASKLVNAWTAGVPALLGPEPAFSQLRRSPLDYIEIRTPQQAINAIRRLKQEPSLYQQMIANGLKRSQDFTVDRIAQQWHDVLRGPIAQRYSLWHKRTQASRIGEFVINAFLNQVARAKANYYRHHGYRPISGKIT